MESGRCLSRGTGRVVVGIAAAGGAVSSGGPGGGRCGGADSSSDGVREDCGVGKEGEEADPCYTTPEA